MIFLSIRIGMLLMKVILIAAKAAPTKAGLNIVGAALAAITPDV
jgi:hypothetical protein